MSVAFRLGAYGVVLASVLTGAYGVGQIVDAAGENPPRASAVALSATEVAPTSQPSSAGSATEDAGRGQPFAAAPAGAVPELVPTDPAGTRAGYTLAPGSTDLPVGQRVPFSFSIIDPNGRPLTDYLSAADGALRMLVLRTDLSGGLQWVHPLRDENGRWSADLDLAAAGEYRVLVDFTPAAPTVPFILGVRITASDPAPDGPDPVLSDQEASR